MLLLLLLFFKCFAQSNILVGSVVDAVANTMISLTSSVVVVTSVYKGANESTRGGRIPFYIFVESLWHMSFRYE